MLDINSLQAFIAVASHKSFSKASQSLHITQPAVSKRVASLEEVLETKLFNRINRQISLTEAGEQLLKKAKELVVQADDLKRYASTLSDDVSGVLNISTSHHIGLHRLPPVLQAFREAYPKVELNLQFDESEKACYQVEYGDLELAIITLPETLADNLLGETAWTDKLNVVVGLDHQMLQLDNVSFQELVLFPCVLPSVETETYKIMQRVLKAHGLTLDVRMTTNNLETLKMLASIGYGWTLLPETMLDDSVKVLDVGKALYRNLGMVSHKKRSLSNSAKAFQQMIRVMN